MCPHTRPSPATGIWHLASFFGFDKVSSISGTRPSPATGIRPWIRQSLINQRHPTRTGHRHPAYVSASAPIPIDAPKSTVYTHPTYS